jgi:hypothetical protein
MTILPGEPWHVQYNTLVYAVPFNGGTADASCFMKLGFANVPPGVMIRSCGGFRFDAPTAALPSIAGARADDGIVRLEWAVDHELVAASVERTTLGDRWESLGAPALVGGHLVRFEDRDAKAGTRYGYRLSWAEGGLRQSTEIAWVDVPAARLALRALSANPSARAPILEFTLPAPSRVRLEVSDLRGRRVQSRDLGMQEAGAHRIEPGAALPPGIYWARLLVPGGEERLKLIVLGR